MVSSRWFLFFLFILSHPLIYYGKSGLTLTDNSSLEFGAESYAILPDPKGDLSIDYIQTLPLDSFNFEFENYSGQCNNFWLRLEINNQNIEKGKWLYALYNHLANRVEVYTIYSGGKYSALDTVGIDLPYYQRNFHTRIPVFELPIHSGKNVFFIKYYSQNYFGLNTVLQLPIDYINYYNKYYFVIGGFYFILLMLFFYNTLFYVSTHDKTYLYYILFVLTAIFDCLKVDHLGFAILWPNSSFMNVFMDEYARSFFVLAMVNYTTFFLELKRYYLGIYKFIWFFCFVYLFQEYFSNLVYDFPFGLEVTTILLFFLLGLILYGAILRLKNGAKSVRLFMIGYLSICAGFVLSYLFFNNLIDGNFFIYYIMFFGISIDAIMFSFALGSRLKQERLEKQQALEAENLAKAEVIIHMEENEKLLSKVNIELEEKVRERTLYIQEANEKLQNQAVLISELNKNLDKENWQLNNEIKNINANRILAKNQTYNQVLQTFSDKVACYRLIAELKWSEGFSCKKCGNKKSSKGTDFLSKRCTKCGTLESVTSNTIFHKLKFPIQKAFYLTYVIFNHKTDLNLSEIARETDLNYQTCSLFKSKIDKGLMLRKKAKIRVLSWEDIIIDN